MPSVNFYIVWPDARVADCYSPSTAINEYFEVGKEYPLAEFMHLARAGLEAASERVRLKYGYACSAAMDTLATLERDAKVFSHTPNAKVKINGFNEGL